MQALPRHREQPAVRLRAVQELRSPLIERIERPRPAWLVEAGTFSRRLRRFAYVCFLAALAPADAFAWGAKTHEIINRRAAEVVPGAAGEAWRPLAKGLGAHASDADDRKRSDPEESPRHYLDADALDRPPFDHVPRTLDAYRRKFGADAARSFGSAPWAIDECYRMLVLSLRQGDWASAGAWAADLGHYVADTHQPLHCTMNHDGQRTGNHGVHLRFEVHMMDRHFREEMISLPESWPKTEGEPIDRCLRWMNDAHAGVVGILAADSTARRLDPSFGDVYEDALWEGTREIAARQVSAAVRDLAMLYGAAWEEAGRPPGPSESPAFRAQPAAALTGDAAESPRLSLRALGVAVAAVASALLLGAL